MVLDLPEKKGTYCIVFRLNSFSFTTRGRKRFSLKEGLYVYVGSAFGTGGLRGRILRHLRKDKPKHWHFDFITTHPSFEPLEVWLFEEQKVECKVASLIGETAEPVNGFGSTDCSCPSHLFRVENLPLLKERLKDFFSVKILKIPERG
jgi:Uri superfamily endonuclease